MKLCGEIVGFVAILFNFLIYQQKDRKNLLKIKVLSGFSWALHYGLLFAFSGMAVCLIGFFRDLTFLLTVNKNSKNRIWLLLIFASISIATSIFTYNNLFDLLPTLASLIAVFSYWQQKPTVTKILGLPISISMLTYDIIKLSYMGIANEIFSLISITWYFISSKKRKKSAV